MKDRRYQSRRWKVLRAQVLLRDGYACQIQGPRCTGLELEEQVAELTARIVELENPLPRASERRRSTDRARAHDERHVRTAPPASTSAASTAGVARATAPGRRPDGGCGDTGRACADDLDTAGHHPPFDTSSFVEPPDPKADAEDDELKQESA